jgi:hypothetical protein
MGRLGGRRRRSRWIWRLSTLTQPLAQGGRRAAAELELPLGFNTMRGAERGVPGEVAPGGRRCETAAGV